MVIAREMLEELISDDGHNGKLSYYSKEKSFSRREGTIGLLKKIDSRNIIHIGCCGHLRNIDNQINNGTHLHKNLIDNFDSVLGFDIYQEAVERLSSYGISDVFACDFVNESDKVKTIIDATFGEENYSILIPEVLEHIPNPVDFLQKVKKDHNRKGNKVVITVPNAYGFGRICEGLFHNSEAINMDHKYMFTPTTILKVMCVGGIKPEEIFFFDLYKYSKIFRKPMLGNTIAVIGSFE